MSDISQEPTVVLPGQGSSYWVLGDLVTFKLTGKETNGAYTVAETTVPPGGGPPPHIHGREDELFALLEGEIGFIFGDKSLSGRAGQAVNLPHGIPHTFKNIGSRPARFLVTATPCGFEDFIHDAGIPAGDLSKPPAATDADVQRLLAACSKHNLEMRFDHRPTADGGGLEKSRDLWVCGLHVAKHLGGKQTNGSFCVITITLRPGQGFPRHSHRREDEMFYVIEGTVTFTLGDKKLTVAPGTFVHVPRGLVHAIQNTSDKPARLLDYHNPADFEQFLEEAGVACADPLGSPPQFDHAQTEGLIRKYGMELGR